MRVLKALKASPMAIDIYCWLTYRMSYLRKSTIIPWVGLQTQFGAEYGRTRDFKARFQKHLKEVILVYQDVRITPNDEGLILYPSPTHVKSLKK